MWPEGSVQPINWTLRPIDWTWRRRYRDSVPKLARRTRGGANLDVRGRRDPNTGVTASSKLEPGGRLGLDRLDAARSDQCEPAELAGDIVAPASCDRQPRHRHPIPIANLPIGQRCRWGRSNRLSPVLHSWVFGPRSATPLLISSIASALSCSWSGLGCKGVVSRWR
jgi:hypothetical protein